MPSKEKGICVIDKVGEIVKECPATREPEALITALCRLDLPPKRVRLEACSLSSWRHDGLSAGGLPAICIETRHANATMKTQNNDRGWAEQDGS